MAAKKEKVEKTKEMVTIPKDKNQMRDMDMALATMQSKQAKMKTATVNVELTAVAYVVEGEIKGVKLMIGDTYFNEGATFDLLKEFF